MKERGTEVADTSYPTNFVGNIGLMYPSDYGYSTSGGTTTNRNTCLATSLYNWSNYSDCYSNSWIYDSNVWQWTITSDLAYSYVAFIVRGVGNVHSSVVDYGNYVVRPVLALESMVEITGGTGTENNPYTLAE